MTRQRYLQQVIDLYQSAPDTPEKARRTDWAVANTFYQQAIPLDHVAHAIRLASLRRLRRSRSETPLQPIRSLAYIRPILEQLQHQAHDPDYVDYVKRSYQIECDSNTKNRGAAPKSRGF